jgi:hypothetical protein
MRKSIILIFICCICFFGAGCSRIMSSDESTINEINSEKRLEIRRPYTHGDVSVSRISVYQNNDMVQIDFFARNDSGESKNVSCRFALFNDENEQIGEIVWNYLMPSSAFNGPKTINGNIAQEYRDTEITSIDVNIWGY